MHEEAYTLSVQIDYLDAAENGRTATNVLGVYASLDGARREMKARARSLAQNMESVAPVSTVTGHMALDITLEYEAIAYGKMRSTYTVARHLVHP